MFKRRRLKYHMIEEVIIGIRRVFFDIPYWKTLLLRHNLDVMHIEKNICDNILGTILNIKGKTKDTLTSRLDLQELNIRKELHPKRNGEKYELPTTCFTLSPEEKPKFLSFFEGFKGSRWIFVKYFSLYQYERSQNLRIKKS